MEKLKNKHIYPISKFYRRISYELYSLSSVIKTIEIVEIT